MKRLLLVAACGLALSCGSGPAQVSDSEKIVPASYLDNSGRDDALAGGVRMIPITTPAGEFRVWTRRFGNNPRVKLLLLHGGPGFDHEYLEGFDSSLPGAGVEYYFYDQLGSFFSDQPDAPELWNIPRFVDEVEQVRRALGLEKDNFYLYGHSWGGILALEYALAHQDHLKGLIISNMMSSAPAYNAYADEVLKPEMDPEVLAEVEALEAAGDYESPRYMELLIPAHYEKHILRMPFADWPNGVVRAVQHVNPAIYVPMQGPSELGLSGTLEDWDRTPDLGQIEVPTLVIGATHDTMDPKYLEMMAGKVQHGRFLLCPNGSHLALYDDRQVYMDGLVAFLKDVDSGTFSNRP